MTLLSSGDVAEVVGLPEATLNQWYNKGVAVPVEGGNGSGDHRRFTLMQVVGLALGAKLRRGQGAALPFVKAVVDNLGAMTEEELLKEFEQGHTHIFPTRHTPFIAPQYEDMEDFNVQTVYEDVTKQVREIEKRLRDRGGRTRGLAEAQ